MLCARPVQKRKRSHERDNMTLGNIGEFVGSGTSGLIGAGILIYLIKDKLLGTAIERKEMKTDIKAIKESNPVSQSSCMGIQDKMNTKMDKICDKMDKNHDLVMGVLLDIKNGKQ